MASSRRITFLLALSLVAVLADLGAQGASGVPGDLAIVKVGPHEFHRRVLENGLHAIAVRDQGKGVSVFMIISAGKRHETPATTGLAHLTEHAMYAGTKKAGLGEHDRRIRAMGGESNAFTREDYTLFYDHEFPVNQLGKVLGMEADRLRGLTFDRTPVLYERERLRREELDVYKPTDARRELLESRVFKVHGYGAGLLDKKGNTKAPGLGLKVIRDFYNRYYHPEHTAVVVVGELPPAKALAMIEGRFGELPRGPKRQALPQEPAIETSRTEKIATDLSRDRRTLVWLVPALQHPDRPALDALARLVSRRTTADGAPIEAKMGGRVDQELFQIAATGKQAAKELNTLLARLLAKPIAADEVKTIKILLADDFASMPLRARPYFSLAGSFGIYEVLGHPQYPAGYEAAIKALTPASLLAVARRHLRPDRCVSVAFEASGKALEPLPTDLRALAKAADEALEAGDLDRAIEAFTRLLKARPSRMYQVIYLASRGQAKIKQKNYDGAIGDYEEALKVIDYPAVRDLLKEARALKAGKK